MRHWRLAAAGLGLTLGLAAALPLPALSQSQVVALGGRVSSADDAAMEGVLVSATRTGSNITVTVVTGADGRYGFPADRLGPGQYRLAVRAIGYELDQPQGSETIVDVQPTEAPEQAATKDLRLGSTKDLAAQLSNG